MTGTTLTAYDPVNETQRRFLNAVASSDQGYSLQGSGDWAGVASRYGLDYSDNYDKAAGSWYLAQETYARATGHALEADLAAGELDGVESVLSSIWPSITGSQSAPQGLAQSLVGATGAASGEVAGEETSQSEGPVTNLFQRGGLVIIGGIIILVGLFALFRGDAVRQVVQAAS